jgi:hypothetical protein
VFAPPSACALLQRNLATGVLLAGDDIPFDGN